MVKVTWGTSEQVIESVDALDALLEELHADALQSEPVLVTVELPHSGDSLSIGLGHHVSVLNSVSGSGDPPYLSSRGGPEDEEGATVQFRYMGEWSEYPMKNVIPMDMARQAMRHFVRTGALDPAVAWEQV